MHVEEGTPVDGQRYDGGVDERLVATPRYDSYYYARQSGGSLRSARQIVPFVADLVRPASVVDVGCGVGTWLSVFRENHVSDVLGLDGAYVDASALQIPNDDFLPCDLRSPPPLDRRFDLAMSLEVAEHLPHDSSPAFVQYLVSLAPVVLFSAATPLQGGRGHQNERWQHEWAELFADQGYLAFDLVRPRFWNEAGVVWFYAQNTVIYASPASTSLIPALHPARATHDLRSLSSLHPSLLSNLPVKSAARILLRSSRRAVKRNRLVRKFADAVGC